MNGPIRHTRGFTLIELLIAITIIAILIAVGIANYRSMTLKSRDASTIGNLGVIRSALSIYYGDNHEYPTDDLSSLVTNRNLEQIPIFRTFAHQENRVVVAETSTTDSGSWSYDNAEGSVRWGKVVAGCLHNDQRGTLWSSF